MNDARTITRDLGGKWYGTYGTAPCPICQTSGDRKKNALNLADGYNGHLLLDCKKSKCDFVQLLAAIGITKGDYSPPDTWELAQREAEQRAKSAKRATQARALWENTTLIRGTLAEVYLRRRGITCDLPETLRFHPVCGHPTAKRLPALVALVEGINSFAVHRTYLTSDGTWKADVDPKKAMLGSVAGGAVRLAHHPGPLVVAEGIETGLSLLSGLLSGPARVWAALSTSGMKTLELPPHPSELFIATDGDPAGQLAGDALANRALGLGWQVKMLPAPDGSDWNDVLQQQKGVI